MKSHTNNTYLFENEYHKQNAHTHTHTQINTLTNHSPKQ